MDRTIERVVLGLADGPDTEAAIGKAVEIAKAHNVELAGLAIIDTKTLRNIGPVPLGGNYYAAQLRNTLIARARHNMAAAVHSFEHAARAGGVRFGVNVEEGDPIPILRARLGKGVALVLPRRAWFDHGVAAKRIDPISRLTRHRIGVAELELAHDGPIVVFS